MFKMMACHCVRYLVILSLVVTALDLDLDLGLAESSKGTFSSASAYCKDKQCTLAMNKLDWKSATAVATFNDTLLLSGWGVLDISSGFSQEQNQDNEDIMFAAGFLEGALTAKHMETHFSNVYDDLLKKRSPIVIAKLKKWFIMQRAWADSMIDVHKGNSPLWRHVSYILAQLDGLLAGYQNIRGGSDKAALDLNAINILQATGDLFDMITILDPKSVTDWTKFTPSEAMSYFYSMGHCSALIKILPGFENIYMSHSSWFTYQATNRIFKHYNFNVKDPATAAKKLSFSSYPGFLESLDDFYILGSGMVMLQTTNNIFNTSLYSAVTSNSLFAWQRVRVANMMAHGGEEWTKVLSQFNSGTYNNQYMVIDLKNVSLKSPLPDNTLWVAEQIPGLVAAEDLTPILRAGYFSSYNIPFFEEIFTKSGYPEWVKKFGLDYSYELAPRAKIFRRDQGDVTDLDSMKKIMRYNDYREDPYSNNSSWKAICSRGDLSASPEAGGCYDTKVTDFIMAKDFQADAINGPTLGTGLQPFSWTGIFFDEAHDGLPTMYDFPFIRTEPTLKRP